MMMLTCSQSRSCAVLCVQASRCHQPRRIHALSPPLFLVIIPSLLAWPQHGMQAASAGSCSVSARAVQQLSVQALLRIPAAAVPVEGGHSREGGQHGSPEAATVLARGLNGGRLDVLGQPHAALHPALKRLVPGVLPHTSDLTSCSMLIHSKEQKHSREG